MEIKRFIKEHALGLTSLACTAGLVALFYVSIYLTVWLGGYR